MKSYYEESWNLNVVTVWQVLMKLDTDLSLLQGQHMKSALIDKNVEKIKQSFELLERPEKNKCETLRLDWKIWK
jgi:hypothetical protein